MMNKKTLYYLNVLSIATDVDFTIEDVKSNYKMLEKLYHPDKNKSKNAETKFAELKEAKDYLVYHFEAVKKECSETSSNEQTLEKKSSFFSTFKINEGSTFFTDIRLFILFNILSFTLILTYVFINSYKNNIIFVSPLIFIVLLLYFFFIVALLFYYKFRYQQRKLGPVWYYIVLVTISSIVNFAFYLHGHLYLRELYYSTIILAFDTMISSIFMVLSFIMHGVYLLYLFIHKRS